MFVLCIPTKPKKQKNFLQILQLFLPQNCIYSEGIFCGSSCRVNKKYAVLLLL